MKGDVLFFFEKHMDMLPVYEILESRILNEIENVRIKVQKSQITFYNKHLFACVSFMRVRKKKDCPPDYIVVTFGLSHKMESSRIEFGIAKFSSAGLQTVTLTANRKTTDSIMNKCFI